LRAGNIEAAHVRRRDRRAHAHSPDPYTSNRKVAGAAACPVCGAVYGAGRWAWGVRPRGAEERLCPACRRIRDDQPAGWVHVLGPALEKRADEMVPLILNVERHENDEHPLHRVIAIRRGADELTVTTTDPHLARAIGHALHAAYGGELDLNYRAGTPELDVRWTG
jgi:hypothetical protein